MCVIITSPSRKHRPTLDTLRAGARHNPHGSGLAWIQEGRVHFLKGLSPESLHESLGILEGPVVIHFRYATVGGKRSQLCHPFPVSPSAAPKVYGTAKEVLFHNGHWSEWEEFADEQRLELSGPVSDTRVIAVGVYLGGAEWLATLPGRFVLFSPQELHRFGDWHEVGGCHFSNLNWQPVAKSQISNAQSEINFPRRRGNERLDRCDGEQRRFVD